MVVTRVAQLSTASVTGTTHTRALDCAGGSTLIVAVEDATNTAGNTTGVTYAGVAMTELGRIAAPSQNRQITLWGLHSPASGSNNIIATRTSAAVGRFTMSAVALSNTDTGVALTTDVVSASATSSSKTFNFTNDTNAYIFAFGKFLSAGQSAGTGASLLSTYDIVSDFEASSVSTNHALTVNFTSSGYCMLGLSVAGTGGGGPTSTNSAFLAFM